MTAIDLDLTTPGGEPVDLWRTLISHGFAGLAPTVLDEEARTLALTIRVPRGRPRRVRIAESGPARARVDVLGPRPGPTVVAAVLDGVAHVLRLDQDLSGFYRQVLGDPDLAWAAAGAGRMLRSPTVFEDVVKTICTTNCAWGATVRMVNALVIHLGEPGLGGDGPLTNAFPTPAVMAAASRSTGTSSGRATAGPTSARSRPPSRAVRSTSRRSAGRRPRSTRTRSSRPRSSRCRAWVPTRRRTS
jgi:3-methyladenine DNA glycosylase/8-oxoguanine DNA glycosylase